MQRTWQLHTLSWALAACLATLGADIASAQNGYRAGNAPRSSATGGRSNTSRPAARPAQTGNTRTAPAPSASAQAKGAAPRPAAQPASQPAKQAATQAVASGKFMLTHRLKAGEVIRTRTVHVANTLTRIQGTEDVSQSKTVSDKVWEIRSVTPDGLITLEYRIDAVEMSQKQGDNPEITYNSRTDKEPPEMFSRVVETIAKPIATVTIDPSGAVVERDKQSKAPPLGMGELALPLPKEPVAIGAQWSIPRECRVKLDNGTQKVMKLREQYTLEKVSAGVATIRIQSQPLTPVEEPSVEAQLMQQMSQGVAKFDIDRGRLISKELDWDDEVVGFRGAETALTYSARFTEETVESEPSTATSTRSASAPGTRTRK
jgi:hypothetical protein